DLCKAGRGAEAVPIIDDCFPRAAGQVVLPNLLEGLISLRLHYFGKVRDAAGCRQSVAMWEKLNRSDVRSLYSVACWQAVTAEVIGATDKSESGVKVAGTEADRAMALLRQAVAAGYQNLAHMRKDTDLDVLRDRADFKQLLEELAAKQAETKK